MWETVCLFFPMMSIQTRYSNESRFTSLSPVGGAGKSAIVDTRLELPLFNHLKSHLNLSLTLHNLRLQTMIDLSVALICIIMIYLLTILLLLGAVRGVRALCTEFFVAMLFGFFHNKKKRYLT